MRRDLARSRGEAKDLIALGAVSVDGIQVTSVATRIHATSRIDVADVSRWVSRGARKLAAALEEFRIDVRGKECLDVGASTGGFTEALLAYGASEVTAVDVGRDQLADTVRADPRVRVFESTDIRGFAPPDGRCFEMIVVDVSFISVLKVLPDVLEMLCARGDMVVLVKPQFEVGRERLAKDGLVRDESARSAALDSVQRWMAAEGLDILGVMESPLKGGSGNVEYLLWAQGRGAQEQES